MNRTKRKATVPIVRAMDVSTSHMPESKPDFGGLRHVEHEFGYVVFIPDKAAEPAGMVIPEWIRPLVTYGMNQQCLLLNFDAAADEFDIFPQYDW